MGTRNRALISRSHWIDALAARLIRRAARDTPGHLSQRLEEEWLAAVWEQHVLARLPFALGCCWAARMIARDQPTASVSAIRPAVGGGTMPAYAYRAGSHLSRVPVLGAGAPIMCEINTTPLIDVMLVLLVTLIITLPLLTHAVKLDLPQRPSPVDAPAVIDLSIDFDGTVVWNGTPVASLQLLESYLHAEAGKNPQPEIHLRADRRARYDVVAKVMAAVQHNHIEKMGFADTAEFQDW